MTDHPHRSIVLTTELSDADAHTLARFFLRVCTAKVRPMADSEVEARMIVAALRAIHADLRALGYDSPPRLSVV